MSTVGKILSWRVVIFGNHASQRQISLLLTESCLTSVRKWNPFMARPSSPLTCTFTFIYENVLRTMAGYMGFGSSVLRGTMVC